MIIAGAADIVDEINDETPVDFCIDTNEDVQIGEPEACDFEFVLRPSW